jgi:hypothetical protein
MVFPRCSKFGEVVSFHPLTGHRDLTEAWSEAIEKTGQSASLR